MFDFPYYNKLHSFINKSDNVVYTISDLTDTPDKFIYHLKYYIDTRTEDDAEIELNVVSESEKMYGATHSQFRILEFFDSKARNMERLQAFSPVYYNTAPITAKYGLQSTETPKPIQTPVESFAGAKQAIIQRLDLVEVSLFNSANIYDPFK